MRGTIGYDVEMAATNDAEIRLALHHKKLRAYRKVADTIVVDELGLAHAKVRIDIAVINGSIHGYEIKSGSDTLDRLPAQLELYGLCLQKLTLVCAPRHTNRIEILLPNWCGILEAAKGKRGAVKFSTVRRARVNPGLNAVHLAHLLWRPEAVELLSSLGASQNLLRRPRSELYEELAKLMTAHELTAAIRRFMKLRRTWRGHQAHA